MKAGHVLIDFAGRLLSVDGGFGTIMQEAPPALIGRSVMELTAPADRDECAVAIDTLRATRQPFEISKRFQRINGSLIWTTNTVSLVENGRDPDLMVATITPMVERSALKTPARLLDCAKVLVALRAERNALFDPGMFTDATWDIILAAYITEAEGTTLTQAMIEARLGISPAQARRWIDLLCARGAIEVETRAPDPASAKAYRLTAAMHRQIEGYLSNASQLSRLLTIPSLQI